MAIAHVCQRCGVDLARVRARLDGPYGLMIVRCPLCAGALVRRRHPIARTWHRWRRVDLSLTVLAINLGLLVMVALTTFGHVVWLGRELDGQSPAEFFAEHAEGPLVLIGLWPLVLGAYVTVGLGHWRPRVAAWVALGTLVAAVLTLVAVIAACIESASAARPVLSVLGGGLNPWLRSLALLYLLMLAAVPGILPGRLIAWVLDQGRRGVLRWRRRRAAAERRA